ncbi:MAG: hypothetical protein M1819_001072 [Sarea resinae]|nr:MAG: hypothetical protein M1819_001072 [Sarea resinae]
MQQNIRPRSESPLSYLVPIGRSYYAKSTQITPEYYLELLDRGWRRSGTVFYKPDLSTSCCPHYTIRLDADAFKPAKDQRQALNRWNRHVLGENYMEKAARLRPKTKEEKARRKTDFDLIEAVHECEYVKLAKHSEPEHRFEVILELDNFTEEKYALFANYQRCVHKEPPSKISRDGFKRFLCSSPITRRSRQINGQEQKLGSYHQCYRLDGRLIAIGVLDLLPQCVSGVYFIYHEDFNRWNFGKLGALREIALTLESQYRYYYMGYYIHSCVKMRYKRDYRPQYLLDPETYSWNPLDEDILRRLDAKRYVSLSREQRLEASYSDAEERATETEPSPRTATEKQNDGNDDDNDNDVSDDSDDDPDLEDPSISLLEKGMPGVLTKEQVETEMNLDEMLIKVRGHAALAQLKDLVGWDSSDILDMRTLKGYIAELAACLGPNLAKETVISMG